LYVFLLGITFFRTFDVGLLQLRRNNYNGFCLPNDGGLSTRWDRA
jgi:hypothetical protein